MSFKKEAILWGALKALRKKLEVVMKYSLLLLN